MQYCLINSFFLILLSVETELFCCGSLASSEDSGGSMDVCWLAEVGVVSIISLDSDGRVVASGAETAGDGAEEAEKMRLLIGSAAMLDVAEKLVTDWIGSIKLVEVKLSEGEYLASLNGPLILTLSWFLEPSSLDVCGVVGRWWWWWWIRIGDAPDGDLPPRIPNSSCWFRVEGELATLLAGLGREEETGRDGVAKLPKSTDESSGFGVVFGAAGAMNGDSRPGMFAGQLSETRGLLGRTSRSKTGSETAELYPFVSTL